jgi:hypothetical protein
MTFVRRYTSEPSLDTLLSIESVNIIDLAVPGAVRGAGTGAVVVVGEFEDGPFAATGDEGPLEVFGTADLLQKFGGFGYEYDGVQSNNPSARSHMAELWNGNGYLKLFGFRSSRLFVARVDTSVGEVALDVVASILGGVSPYQLTPGQQLSVTTNPGGTASSTAVAAQVATATGLGASFGSVASGDTIGVRIDGGAQVNVTFSGTDTTVAAVVDRINAALGYTAAANVATQLDISGIQVGTGGSVELIEVTTGVLAKLGHVAAVWTNAPRVTGTGYAGGTIVATEAFSITIDGGSPTVVTFAGAPATPAAAAAFINTTVGQTVCYALPNGQLRLQAGTAGAAGSIALAVGVPSALVKLGFTVGTTVGVGNVANVNAVTAAEMATIINGTAGLSAIDVLADVDGQNRLRVGVNAGGITISIASGALATALGLDPVDTVVSAADHDAAPILAGTRVRTAGGLEWVTMQTIDVPADEVGPFMVKVRPATDNGTAVGTGASTVTVVVDPSEVGPLVVTNPAALTAALTEVQMDNAYLAAFDATLNPKAITKDSNYLLSARRSDAVVRGGRQNCLDATAGGLAARKFVTGDPIGTTVSQSIANVANFRSDRVFYTAKGLKVRVPAIAARGTDGGQGFTADGVITVRPDGPLCTVCATLPPENNPGQQTNLIDQFYEVDAGGETLAIQTYEAWRRAGICAPIVDDVSGTTFQSGVTSSLESGRTTMARRKMADYIQDTAAVLLAPFVKRLSRQAVRDQCRGVWEQFLAQLWNEQNPELRRIEGYTVDDSVNAGNTPAVLAAGAYYIESRVRNLSSLDAIALRTEVGENAVVTSEV